MVEVEETNPHVVPAHVVHPAVSLRISAEIHGPQQQQGQEGAGGISSRTRHPENFSGVGGNVPLNMGRGGCSVLRCAPCCQRHTSQNLSTHWGRLYSFGIHVGRMSNRLRAHFGGSGYACSNTLDVVYSVLRTCYDYCISSAPE